jgi:hypothetical protein
MLATHGGCSNLVGMESISLSPLRTHWTYKGHAVGLPEKTHNYYASVTITLKSCNIIEVAGKLPCRWTPRDENNGFYKLAAVRKLMHAPLFDYAIPPI